MSPQINDKQFRLNIRGEGPQQVYNEKKLHVNNSMRHSLNPMEFMYPRPNITNLAN